MVVKKIPHIRFHWSKFVDIFHTSIIPNVMSRFKFEAVLSLVETCNELCGQLWNLEQNLHVDEGKYIGKYLPI
jgi:hypothetical protein